MVTVIEKDRAGHHHHLVKDGEALGQGLPGPATASSVAIRNPGFQS